MTRLPHRHWSRCLPLLALGVAALAGCGTTRSTDSQRTATEQLLVSDAIDRAVQTIGFAALAGQTVFLDDSKLSGVVDRAYLVSTLRQHLLASGCILRDDRDDADIVVEVRAGAVGTDRNDLLFGVPSMNVPQVLPLQGVPAAIPEVPIAKRRDQRGIAKIAVFAYHRETGLPVWQSGTAEEESSSNDVWILGAGPFQRGTVYDGTEFAGKSLHNKWPDEDRPNGPRRSVDLAREATFASPKQLAELKNKASQDPHVQPASHQEAVPAAEGATSRAAAPAASPLPFYPLPQAVIPLSGEGDVKVLPQASSTPQSNFTMRVEESQLLRESDRQSLPPRGVEPVPLPQPRYNSP